MVKWEMVKLGTIGDFKSGGTPTRSKPEYFEGNIPWITTTSLGKTFLDDSDAVEHISAEGVADSSTKIILENSIMIGIRVGVGKVSINTVPMCASQDIISIENINEKQINKQYIVRCIKSYNHYFGTQKRGATIQGINSGVLKSLDISVPPLETQKQIAKTLDTAEELLAIRKQQLAELDNLIISTFYDMFGDPIINEKGWEVKKLSELATIKSGGTPSRSHPEYFEGEIPWITTVALGKTFIDENDAVEYISEDAIELSATKLIKENSLLFGIRVGVGKISINKVPMCINQDIVAIVDVNSNLLNQVYLVKTIKTYAEYFNKQKRGATIQGIKGETLKSIDIPIPLIHLQTQFAEIVTKIEEQKALVKKAIDETQYLFDSLMSEYFE